MKEYNPQEKRSIIRSLPLGILLQSTFFVIYAMQKMQTQYFVISNNISYLFFALLQSIFNFLPCSLLLFRFNTRKLITKTIFLKTFLIGFLSSISLILFNYSLFRVSEGGIRLFMSTISFVSLIYKRKLLKKDPSIKQIIIVMLITVVHFYLTAEYMHGPRDFRIDGVICLMLFIMLNPLGNTLFEKNLQESANQNMIIFYSTIMQVLITALVTIINCNLSDELHNILDNNQKFKSLLQLLVLYSVFSICLHLTTRYYGYIIHSITLSISIIIIQILDSQYMQPTITKSSEITASILLIVSILVYFNEMQKE